jgi:hypothetical protein
MGGMLETGRDGLDEVVRADAVFENKFERRGGGYSDEDDGVGQQGGGYRQPRVEKPRRHVVVGRPNVQQLPPP